MRSDCNHTDHVSVCSWLFDEEEIHSNVAMEAILEAEHVRGKNPELIAVLDARIKLALILGTLPSKEILLDRIDTLKNGKIGTPLKQIIEDLFANIHAEFTEEVA